MTNQHPADNASIKEVAPDTFVDNTGHQLDEHQIRAVVTPHVFAVANELIGQPLAKPARRGAAMVIDGLIIALLTSASLMFVLPTMLYLAYSCHTQQQGKRRNIVLVAAAVMLVSLSWTPQRTQAGSDSKIAATIVVGASALALTRDSCDASCAEDNLSNIAQQLKSHHISTEDAQQLVHDLIDESTIIEDKRPAAEARVMDEIIAYRATHSIAQPEQAPKYSWWQKLQQSDHSILKWLQGILADLGIGFGAAIVYFTVFISWNNGQTLGKKLFGIKVVQLDNSPLSLWQAFGRQGGYSAGFATGLLGFLQIYWDPNRQAIQDKVAETLVLRLNK